MKKPNQLNDHHDDNPCAHCYVTELEAAIEAAAIWMGVWATLHPEDVDDAFREDVARFRALAKSKE